MDLSTWQGMRARDPRRLVLGSAQWGMPYGIANRSGPPSDRMLAEMLAQAAKAGIRTLDTARAYDRSEARIGAALRALAPDVRFRVITKLAPDAHAPGLGIAETLERAQQSLAQSREALGLDVLPVVLLHRFDHRHACGGRLWRMLLAEREAGRIGALGISAAKPEEAWAALDDPDIEVQQVASSLLDLRLLRQGFFARARELGRTVYVRSLFLQGVAHLDPTALPPHLLGLGDAIDTVRRTADRLGVAPAALYLAFARELVPGAHPVIGCETDDQLAELLDHWADDRIDLAALSPLLEALPTHSAELVDPAAWGNQGNDAEAGSVREGQIRSSQPARASVATLPR